MSRLPLILLALLLPLAARAQPPGTSLFAGGQPPSLLNPRMARDTYLLYFRAFAVLDSGLTRGPLWSAEHLTRAGVEAARHVPRENLFHPEPRLPPAARAELSDYVRSGYDRGHMSPSGDMPDAASQEQSFSLANMVPQAPQLNRETWEGIESAVRDLALRDGQLYVVTGPIFRGGNLQALHGRVLVPTDVFKAVYDPARNGAAAYVCRNQDPTRCEDVSIQQLEQLAGIDPFPSLPAGVKATAMPLPRPTPHGYGHRDEHGRGERGREPRHQGLLPTLLERLLR